MDFQDYLEKCQEEFKAIRTIGELVNAAAPIAIEIVNEKRVVLGKQVGKFFASSASIPSYNQLTLKNAQVVY